mgnify:FL=1
MLQLYKNIKTRRIELGLTQSELAEKLGYADKSMIAKIEKGCVDLTQSKILSFANALETTPADLMGWEYELLNPLTKDEQIASFIGSIQSDTNDSFKKKVILMLSTLDELEWESLEHMILKLQEL